MAADLHEISSIGWKWELTSTTENKLDNIFAVLHCPNSDYAIRLSINTLLNGNLSGIKVDLGNFLIHLQGKQVLCIPNKFDVK